MPVLEVMDIFPFPDRQQIIVSLKAPKGHILLTGQFLFRDTLSWKIKGIVFGLPPDAETRFGEEFRAIDCLVDDRKDISIGDLLSSRP